MLMRGCAMSKYTTQPPLPKDMSARYQTILRTLNGELTVTEAAELLGLSREHCHELMNRAARAALGSITPKKAGRKPVPKEERELRAEVEKLRKQNARLREQAETNERLMRMAGGLLRSQAKPRSTRTRKPKAEGCPNEPEEPDGGEARGKLIEATRMRAMGLKPAIAAALVCVSVSTLRRWARRARALLACRGRRGPRARAALDADTARAVEREVRQTRGLCGASALGRALHVSRRQAAAVKRATLTRMERERRARCSRVVVSQPGVLRNLDQLCLGERLALIASDASVPHRTSARMVHDYSAAEVAETLRRDFALHGAPLAMRMDNASAHDAPAVLKVLRAHGVLLLHGPPHHPQYYGQHERQNREHRAWLAASDVIDDAELERMMQTLNERWPRRALAWRTAAEIWNARPPLRVDRAELHAEVVYRAARLADRCAPRLAGRLAIEQTLEHRGYLRRIAGGW